MIMGSRENDLTAKERHIIMLDMSREELKQLIEEVVNKKNQGFQKLYLNKMISGKECCNLLSITFPTLKEYVKRGEIKAYRYGGKSHPKYKQSEVMEFASKNPRYKR